MKKYTFDGVIFFVILLAAFFGSCKTTSYASYDYQSECLGSELDGTQTIKAWGKGKSRADAVEQAKKNAVRDVVFKGLRGGQQGCKLQPIILEVNAEEKYQSYFNKFFSDGGEFTKFVTLQDERIRNQIVRNKVIGDDYTVYSVVVRVKYEDLKNRLFKDKIIK